LHNEDLHNWYISPDIFITVSVIRPLWLAPIQN